MLTLCLLFNQTKELFKHWLLYGLGIMFSMPVSAFMESRAIDLLAAVALWILQAHILSAVAGLLSGAIPGLSGLGGFDSTERVSPAAKVQGDVDLVMSVLIVMAPPMVAMFVSGTLGQFGASAVFGTVGRSSSGSMSGIKPNCDAEATAVKDGTRKR